MTTDVRRTPRRGTSSRIRASSVCTGAGTRDRCPRSGRRVLRSVLRPVRVDPHYARRRQKRFRGGANAPASRLGKPTRVGETFTGVGRFGRSAARRVSPLPQGRGRGTSEKEGGRGLRPCEDQESRLGCSHVVFSLQKSAGDLWSRISSAYAPQKGRSGSSERGPSSESRSAGETVGKGAGRRERRESASPPKTGEVRRKAQGGARAPSSGRDIAKSGGAVAGPGL